MLINLFELKVTSAINSAIKVSSFLTSNPLQCHELGRKLLRAVALYHTRPFNIAKPHLDPLKSSANNLEGFLSQRLIAMSPRFVFYASP
jgi:hypothetical protein